MLRQWKGLFAGLLLGWASGLAALGTGAAIVIVFGLYDVSATTPHVPWFGWLVHRTMIRSVKLRATEMAPRSFTRAQLTRGAHLYESHCAICHGGPGISRAHWVDGLTPTPPYLLDAARRWSLSQLHFIIANGVKMTAMPAWKLTLSDQENLEPRCFRAGAARHVATCLSTHARHLCVSSAGNRTVRSSSEPRYALA